MIWLAAMLCCTCATFCLASSRARSVSSSFTMIVGTTRGRTRSATRFASSAVRSGPMRWKRLSCSAWTPLGPIAPFIASPSTSPASCVARSHRASGSASTVSMLPRESAPSAGRASKRARFSASSSAAFSRTSVTLAVADVNVASWAERTFASSSVTSGTASAASSRARSVSTALTNVVSRGERTVREAMSPCCTVSCLGKMGKSATTRATASTSPKRSSWGGVSDRIARSGTCYAPCPILSNQPREARQRPWGAAVEKR